MSKTSKRALPNVPGAATVQALGDAVFGKGNAVVEQTYPVTFAGRPVTVRLSVEEVVRYLTRTGWVEDKKRGRRTDFRDFAYLSDGATRWARVPNLRGASDMALRLRECAEDIAFAKASPAAPRHPLDVVESILAARHGAAPPGDADPITAAILRLFAVAPDRGIAEDEVVRHLLASGLDVDADDVGDRLVKMHVADVLKEAWRGKADKRRALPLVYARGPAFPVAS